MSKKRIAVIDCETDPFEIGIFPKPFIWGYYDGRTYEQFRKTRHLVKFLKHKNVYCYAHNGGRFDHHFLIDYTEQTTGIKVINGRLAKWYLGKATMLDSYLILPVPQSAMKKDDFSYWKMHKDCREKYMPEIEKYLRHDCTFLHEYIERFISEYGMNLTLAGAAMTKFCDLYDIEKPYSSSSDFYESISKYYYGGRVDAFETGIFNREYKLFDINSAYPYVMKKIKHPFGYKKFNTVRPSDRQLNRSFLTIECHSKGALPARHKLGIAFPDRKMTYHITGHEFKSAIKYKALSDVKIKECIVFENTINFSRYVDHFYRRKKKAKIDGDKPGYVFAKLFMNALYGKWGSNPNTYHNYILGMYGERAPLYKGKDENGQVIEKQYEYGPQIRDRQIFKRKLEDYEKRFFNVAVSASITGAVRAYLFENLNKVSNPLYCDTDSIICQDKGRLKLGAELGQWDIEAEAFRAAVAGKKLYALWLNDGGFKIASKGAKLNAYEIAQIAENDVIKWKKESPVYGIAKEPYFLEREIKKPDTNFQWIEG